MNVAEGRTIVTSVLSGKLTEVRLPEGRLSDGRVAEGTLTVGKLFNGRLMEGRLLVSGLTEERPIELREKEGRLTGAGVGKLLRLCSNDTIEAVRLDGWPAGTLMGVELMTGIVNKGITMGLAEIRTGASRKGRCLE